LILLLSPSLLLADLIVIKNGDRFFGKIQNKHFALYSTYGQIVIQYDFLKSISFDENKTAFATFISINNDRFSGTVLNDEFHILLENGDQKSIAKNNVKRLRIDTPGPSYKITTAIFTMENNDKFSGKLLNKDFKVNADYMVKLIPTDAINRIEFLSGEQDNVKVLLNNGDLIRGDMYDEQFDVLPEVIGQLALGKPALRSIQLNAPKMVLKEYHSLPAADRDSDGDGVPDDVDKCPDSPWGFEVDADGCSKDPNLAKGGNPFDQDQDGVLNDMDKCPNTPMGVPVDERGCSKLKAVFFEFDRHELQERYHSSLEVVAATLKANPSMSIQIQGHTDNVGSPEYNMNLSEKRAREVKWFIVNKGIDESRITTIGFGDNKNQTTNDTAEGRAQNRRAEIVVQKP
jgi:outer membrane protein OmpA-like peptidoglycan-associated protein